MSYRGPDPKFESVTATESLNAGDVAGLVENTSNTASSTATLSVKVAGASAADPIHQAVVNGVTTWSWGIDNSDSDSWKLNPSAALGTTDSLIIDTSGNMTVEGSVTADSLKIEDSSNIGTLDWTPTATRTLTLPDTTGSLAERSAPIEASRIKVVTEAAYTILDTDGYDTILVTTGTSDRIITLPTASANTGRRITVKKVDAYAHSSSAGVVQLTEEGSDAIDGYSTIVLPFKGDFATVQSDGTTWSILSRRSVSPWQDVELTLTAYTPTDATARMRRVGDTIEIDASYLHSGAGSGSNMELNLTQSTVGLTTVATGSANGKLGYGSFTNSSSQSNALTPIHSSTTRIYFRSNAGVNDNIDGSEFAANGALSFQIISTVSQFQDVV